jgi:hypothetical protein
MTSGPGWNHQPTQYVYVQQAPKPASNGLAVAGMVLGIVGTVCSLIPFVGVFLCWLPALLGIIFGFIGLGTAKRAGGFRRTEAITAIVCGFLPIPIILFGVMILAGLGASSQSS